MLGSKGALVKILHPNRAKQESRDSEGGNRNDLANSVKRHCAAYFVR
ncbi:MAG: hypothetical protein BMS9Abin01_1068 [Gammaproteobacteria bacterium]|nr:MAG: hypothetical protein BMS9Abin01_1068 [Gammaproteobacteria bacterium]